MVYLKCLYQLSILCYLHNKRGSQDSLNAINMFLKSFGLDFLQLNNPEFADTYYKLSGENKNMVKEAIQDLVVFSYIAKHSYKDELLKLDKEQLLSLLQLFPDSSILYIMYGVMEKDTAVKVGAFLKCLQIDQ